MFSVTPLNRSTMHSFTLHLCYESGSENFNIPTPLQSTPSIHHVSSNNNISFDLVTYHSMSTSQSHCKPVWHWLSFNTSDDKDHLAHDSPPICSTMTPQNLLGFAQLTCYKPIYTKCDDLEEDDEEEDLQTVPIDDDHWTTEEIPDRQLCIYEHSVPHSLCPYPCL